MGKKICYIATLGTTIESFFVEQLRALAAAGERHVVPRRADVPRRQQRRVVAQDRHAEDVVKKVQTRLHAVGGIDAVGVTGLGQPEKMVVFQASGSFLLRKLRIILP